jgi:hypothetical protein
MCTTRGERRALRAIESELLSDPQLAGLFFTFTRVNRDECLPKTERLRYRTARRAWHGIRALLTLVFVPPPPVGAELRPGQPGGR